MNDWKTCSKVSESSEQVIDYFSVGGIIMIDVALTMSKVVVSASEGKEEMPRLNAWRSHRTTLNVLDVKSCHTAIKPKARRRERKR